MIKIQARMVVIPHTMAVCLIYSSMQAPGLFVPGLSACKEQGLFTFSTVVRKQAAHTFMLHSGEDFWMKACLTSSTKSTSSEALELFFLSCSSSLVIFLPFFCFNIRSLSGYNGSLPAYHVHKV